MSEIEREIDPEKMEQRIGEHFGRAEAAFTCALGYLGDRLGLYRALADAGPSTSEELAGKTGLHERWVREWLRQQAAAGILEHEGGRFSLSPEQEQIHAREESPYFGAGLFQGVLGLLGSLEDVEASFRTGTGAPYDAFGREVAVGIERTLAPFYRTMLVPKVLPILEGVVEKLERGAKVADVGCGAGVALLEMARAFPRSDFHGYDSSRVALERAEAHRAAEGAANVAFHDASHAGLPEDGSFDLVTTLDCIHDMTHPEEAIGAIRRSLRPDGTWLAADMRGQPSFAENLEAQPLSGLLYGFSVLCCMRAALATPDGAGLGTLRFPEAVARRMAREAGFGRFERHDFGHPMNDFYEIRP